MSIIDNALRQSMQDQVKKKKLWTNASPTSSFANQKITLDLTGYQGVRVKLAYNNDSMSDDQTEFDVEVGKNSRAVMFGPLTAEGVSILATARVITAETDGVKIGTAYSKNTGITIEGTANNTRQIPIDIYGIKNILGGAARKIKALLMPSPRRLEVA